MVGAKTDLHDATVTFGTAARVAGLTEKQLRGWLDDGLFRVVGDVTREARQWRRFSVVDVVRLRLIVELRGYGMTVPGALAVIDTELLWQFEGLAEAGHTELRQLSAHFETLSLAVTRHGAKTHWVQIEGPWPGSDPEATDWPSFVLVRLGPLVTAVIEKLASGGEPAGTISRGRKTGFVPERGVAVRRRGL